MKTAKLAGLKIQGGRIWRIVLFLKREKNDSPACKVFPKLMSAINCVNAKEASYARMEKELRHQIRSTAYRRVQEIQGKADADATRISGNVGH